MVLPALVDGDGPPLFQSLAIIEYLNEVHPEPPLLPADPRGRARVRGLAQMVACEGHPLLTPRVRQYLEHELKLDAASAHDLEPALDHRDAEKPRGASGRRYVDRPLLPRRSRRRSPTSAWSAMSPRPMNTQCDLAPYPTVKRVFDTSMALPAFAKAHPLVQPDTPEAMRTKVTARARQRTRRHCRSEATKQSSCARSAPTKKRSRRGNLSLYFARLPARGWIASLRSQ